MLGMLLSFASLLSISSLILGNPVPFAFKFTLGNLLSMGSSSFLVGPSKQLRGMFNEERRGASVAYLSALALTMLCIFKVRIALLTVGAIVIQFCAMVWYSASYFPYGQKSLKRCLRFFL